MSVSAEAIANHFGLVLSEPMLASSSAARRSIAVVRLNPQTGQRELATVHWGLIPPGAKAPTIDDRMLYARTEGVDHKPGYREAFGLRRCLIPADGFYEWKRERAGKQAHFIRLRNGHLFAFGGVWDRWEGAQEKSIESCAILTTEANELVRLLHARMPVIIRPEHYDQWLNPHTPIESLSPLLQHYPAREMTAYPVGLPVPPTTHGEPETMEAVETQPGEAEGAFHPVFDELSGRKGHRQTMSEREGGKNG
jgi:putative SOS response-associated peptidase YedK